MICHICGQDAAQVRRASRSYGRGADLFVIENVPLISCPHCGESYLTAATLHELECIKLHRRAMAQERCSAYCCAGGYRLHPLSGERQGYWSVKVTGNWRITFRCEDGYAEDVNLEDYH
jgi:YgiT-type zinc finger domain-containing protein